MNAYLQVAYGHFWTLDRSGFYGLLFKPVLLPTSGVAGLWLAVSIQAAIVSAILILAARRIALKADSKAIYASIAATALFTSLPWHAAQLMPDAFTGPLILLAWLAASRSAGAPGTALLWLATALLTLMHYTHLGIAATCIGITLAASAAFRTPTRELAYRAFAGFLTIALAVSAHLAINHAYFNRWAVSPLSSWFLFARLTEDGITQPWFDRHCGRDGPRQLSEIRNRLPKDSQLLLWSESSPLVAHFQDKAGKREFWEWDDMLGVVVRGSLREEPVAFARSAAAATIRQFTRFEALDDLCPETCTLPTLTLYRPDAARPLLTSRQLLNELPKTTIRAITTPVDALGLLLLLPFLFMALRRADKDAATLLMAVTACLIANAAMTGALSDVHDPLSEFASCGWCHSSSFY